MDNRPELETTGSILLVDDAAPNLQLLSQMLTRQGYEVRAVTSGAQALEAVKEDLPDLIRSLLAKPDTMTRVAERGRALVLAEHTYEHRIHQIFEQVGLSAL